MIRSLKWLQQPDLGQAKARNQKLHPGLRNGWLKHGYMGHLLLPSCHISRKLDPKLSSWDSNYDSIYGSILSGSRSLRCCATIFPPAPNQVIKSRLITHSKGDGIVAACRIGERRTSDIYKPRDESLLKKEGIILYCTCDRSTQWGRRIDCCLWLFWDICDIVKSCFSRMGKIKGPI